MSEAALHGIGYGAPADASPVLPVVRADGLVLLLFAHVLLANTIFKPVQIGVELLLGAWLISRLINARFSVFEILVAIVYLFSMAASLFEDGLVVTMLNAKILGLAILSVFYFRRVRIESHWIARLLWLNIAVIVYVSIFGAPNWYVFIGSSYGGSFADTTHSRPLGLFLNTHASAFISAVFLLYLTDRAWWIALLSMVVLNLNRSYFVLVAYVGQIAASIIRRVHLEKPLYILLLAGLPLMLGNLDVIRNLDVTEISGIFGPREQISYAVIADQILDAKAYVRVFTLVPKDPTTISIELTGAGNEIGFFLLIQEAGFVLALLFLWLLGNEIAGFRVFLMIAMLHYGMATTPLTIFLMIHFSFLLRSRAILGPNEERRWRSAAAVAA